LDRRLGGLQSRSGRAGEEKNSQNLQSSSLVFAKAYPDLVKRELGHRSLLLCTVTVREPTVHMFRNLCPHNTECASRHEPVIYWLSILIVELLYEPEKKIYIYQFKRIKNVNDVFILYHINTRMFGMMRVVKIDLSHGVRLGLTHSK
jgi:hypothetical protein